MTRKIYKGCTIHGGVTTIKIKTQELDNLGDCVQEWEEIKCKTQKEINDVMCGLQFE